MAGVTPPSAGDLIPVITIAPTADYFSYEFDFAGGTSVATLLAILMAAAGAVFLVAGARLFKVTLFAFAFIFAGTFGFWLFFQWFEDAKASLIAAAVMGLIAGVATLKIWKLAIFILGAGVGATVWVIAKALVPGVFADKAVYYVSLLGCIILFGGVSLYMEKMWLLIGSPVMGAFILVQGIDHFTKQDLNVLQMMDYGITCRTTDCKILYGSIIGLTIFGWVVQYFFTSEYAKARREKNAERNEGREEGRREAMETRRENRRKERKRRRKYSDHDY